jgi:hypothetical protein
MLLDELIERHVRDAFGSAVNRDGDRLVESLRGLDEADSQRALGLALYAVGFVVNDVERDGAADKDLLELARQIVESESGWVTLDENAIVALLRAAATGNTTLAGVNKDDVVFLTFVSGGHLLAAFSLDNQRWHEYLDEIWAVLESAPDPQ